METYRTRSILQVPIHADTMGGLGEMKGLLTFDGQRLQVQWQTKDALFGVIKSGPQTLDIPLSKLEGVSMGLGWFWLLPYIALRMNDFALATGIPGTDGHEAKLRVRFRDRKLLAKLVEAVNFARAKGLHDALTAELADPPLLAPQQTTPVIKPEPQANEQGNAVQKRVGYE